jgi:hypothetical protein
VTQRIRERSQGARKNRNRAQERREQKIDR